MRGSEARSHPHSLTGAEPAPISPSRQPRPRQGGRAGVRRGLGNSGWAPADPQSLEEILGLLIPSPSACEVTVWAQVSCRARSAPGSACGYHPQPVCLHPPAPATHPHPRPFPCLPVFVETSLPQGLHPGGLYSRGPWLNTPPSCFLQSLRLCHPKMDAQTSVLSLLSPQICSARGSQLQTWGPWGRPQPAWSLLPWVSPTFRASPAPGGRSRHRGAPWRHLGPGRHSLGQGGSGDDLAGRWSVGSPCRPAAETQVPREGEAVDTLVSRVPAHPHPGGKVLGLGTCGSPGSYSHPLIPGGAALPSELQSRRPV